MEQTPQMLQHARVWATLRQIDVSDHIEKKLGLSYLSWAWAWGVLMDHFPDATYEFLEPEVHGDGSVTIHCEMVIGGVIRRMWLPVMDHKNNAIKHPDARKISDTKMRCLVKTMAMFGLGHYIYAGEDTPKEESVREPVPASEPAQESVSESVQDIPTEQGAAEMVEKLLDFAKEFCTDKRGLIGFWRDNKQLIDQIDTRYPAQFAALKQGFTQLREKVGN